MLVEVNQHRLTALLLALTVQLALAPLAMAENVKADQNVKIDQNLKIAENLKEKRADKVLPSAALDPSVIDPVGKLAQISSSVKQSSDELASISNALDKLNDELARVEKQRPGKVTKASFEALQKRFKDTIDRSYVVEKRVKDSLAKSQADIENVHKALTAIQTERAAGTSRKAVMTDAEISECLKDLDDERATIKALQQSLVDPDAKQNDEPNAKPSKKEILKSKTSFKGKGHK